MDWIGTRRIRVISALWSDAREELKTNLDIFNLETKRTALNGEEDQEAAAFATKTGQWVKAYNFKAIQSIRAIPIGIPGGYEQVEVEFVRARRKKK